MLWRLPPKIRLENRMWQATLNEIVWCRNLGADCPIILDAHLVLAVSWLRYLFTNRFRIRFHTHRIERGGGNLHPWLTLEWYDRGRMQACGPKSRESGTRFIAHAPSISVCLYTYIKRSRETKLAMHTSSRYRNHPRQTHRPQ